MSSVPYRHRRNLIVGLPSGLLVQPFGFTQRRPNGIGVLSPLGASEFAPYRDVFVRAMLNRGYARDTQYILVERFAEGKDERMGDLAVDLVSLNPDIIIALGVTAALAVQKTSARIPIVFLEVGEPVLNGLAESIGRPGRNATGLSNFSMDLDAKRLQLLKEIVPGLSRVAVLLDSVGKQRALRTQQMETAAAQLGIRMQPFSANAPTEIEAAFESMAQQRAQGVVVQPSYYFWARRQLLASLALRGRLPSMFSHADYAKAGGLVSYGIDAEVEFEQLAGYVDRILKGARPGELPIQQPTRIGELPIQQPTRIEMVVNGRTADALRLVIPPLVIQRADRVI